MNIPTFQYVQFVDEEGWLTSPMQMYNDELNNSMRDALSENGWTVPQLTTAQITQIQPTMPNGTIWFNTNLAKLQVKTAAGVVETITST